MTQPQAVANAAKNADALIDSQKNTSEQPEAPKTEEAAPVTETPQATEASESSTVNWENRYKTLQGKYNAEIPRLQDEVKRLQSKPDDSIVKGLQEEISQLKAKINTTPDPVSPSFEQLNRLRDDYGDDFMEGVQGVAQQMQQPLLEDIAALKQQVQATDKSVSDVSNRAEDVDAQSVKTVLRGILSQKGVDFDQVNTDPLFTDWLNERTEELYGMPRASGFSDAYQQRDLNRVARFFEDYVASHAGSQATTPDLSKHVTTTSSAPAESNPAESEAWTDDSIKELYAKQRSMDPKEFTKLEAKLFQAIGANT